MNISATVIADSKNEFGNRITTLIVTMPRYILAEFNTHRMLSKNSASSRAIPFQKMMDSVLHNPFIPMAWQQDHKGMQGTEYITDKDKVDNLNRLWLQSRSDNVDRAESLNRIGVTKQMVNRLLEPFMYHTVIVTGTEWENFFALRCPKYWLSLPTNGDLLYSKGDDKHYRSWKDVIKSCPEEVKERMEIPIIDKLQYNKGQADIHMMAIAEAIWDAMNESVPKELKAGEWHIPYGDNINYSILAKIAGDKIKEDLPSIWTIKIATARCARVSYTIVGEESKEPNYENDIKLHDRLATSGHWSPFEHCAYVPEGLRELHDSGWWSGNFKGFIQYRKTFNNENITK